MSGFSHFMFEVPPDNRTIEILLPSSSASPRLIVSRIAGSKFCFQILSSKIRRISPASRRSETQGDTSESGRCGTSTLHAGEDERSEFKRQFEIPEQIVIFACSTDRSRRR